MSILMPLFIVGNELRLFTSIEEFDFNSSVNTFRYWYKGIEDCGNFFMPFRMQECNWICYIFFFIRYIIRWRISSRTGALVCRLQQKERYIFKKTLAPRWRLLKFRCGSSNSVFVILKRKWNSILAYRLNISSFGCEKISYKLNIAFDKRH